MPNYPFMKVYCSPRTMEIIRELAKLNSLSVAAQVRSILDSVNLEKLLAEARHNESLRLEIVQRIASTKGGQKDWVAMVHTADVTPRHRERQKPSAPAPRMAPRGRIDEHRASDGPAPVKGIGGKGGNRRATRGKAAAATRKAVGTRSRRASAR